MGIIERRIRGKLRAKEVGFFSGRASYRAIRTNKRRKGRITKVVGEFFG